MNRRDVLLGGAATAAASLLGTGPARAAVQCSAYDAQGIQQCTAGINIGAVTTARQRCQNWCWAACTETIFALYGLQVPQEAIVRRIYGDQACERASGVQIAHAAYGPWQDVRGRRFFVQPVPLLDLHMGIWAPNLGAQVANELANNVPLINGAVGHATVLTAMTYLRDANGRGRPTNIVVRDPWPDNPNRRSLDEAEIKGTFFVMKLHIS